MRIKKNLGIFIALFVVMAVFALVFHFQGASTKREQTSYEFKKAGYFSAHIVPADGQRRVQDIPVLALTYFPEGDKELSILVRDKGLHGKPLLPITCQGAYFQKAPGILWICIQEIAAHDERYKPADRTYQPDISVGWFFTRGEIKDGEVTLEDPSHFDAHCWVAYLQAANLEDPGIVKGAFATLFNRDPLPPSEKP